jgi:hypothetical protein
MYYFTCKICGKIYKCEKEKHNCQNYENQCYCDGCWFKNHINSNVSCHSINLTDQEEVAFSL